MMSVSLAELAVRFGCSIEGDPDIRVSHVAPLQKAGADAIAFFATPSYRKHLGATRAGAVILGADWVAQCPTAALITDNPHAVYARVARILHPAPAFEPGVAPSAVVAAGAELRCPWEDWRYYSKPLDRPCLLIRIRGYITLRFQRLGSLGVDNH